MTELGTKQTFSSLVKKARTDQLQFFAEEVREVISSFAKRKAPSPDGIN